MNNFSINIPGLTIICASQGGGKSHLCKYIISKYKNNLKYGLVFSHTAFNDNNFNYIPKKYIYSHYNSTALTNLMKIQEQQIKQRGIALPCFVIFDDCIFDNMFKDQQFMNLITQVRHYNCLIIFTTQYPNKLPPIVRENAFQVCIFSSDTKRSTSALYESYGMSKFQSEKDFQDYINQNTGNHQFIFYNRKQNNKKTKYLIMKAPAKIKNFSLNY